MCNLYILAPLCGPRSKDEPKDNVGQIVTVEAQAHVRRVEEKADGGATGKAFTHTDAPHTVLTVLMILMSAGEAAEDDGERGVDV
jgi:hypothetical protein